jgi:hypothetical protein
MYPFLVAVSAGEGGLNIDSVADCGQIMTIDRSRIVEVRTRVTDSTMTEIDNALRISLSIYYPNLLRTSNEVRFCLISQSPLLGRLRIENPATAPSH